VLGDHCVVFHVTASASSWRTRAFKVHHKNRYPARNSKEAYAEVRFEVSTAMTVKNVVFWDIKTQFGPHRKHNTSPLQRPAS
jgi:hypothetical protein